MKMLNTFCQQADLMIHQSIKCFFYLIHLWICINSTIGFLLNLTSDMVREWPHRQAQTKAAMKKERPLEEKVLADVRKRVSQIKGMIKPALENSSLSSNITTEAKQTAQDAAKAREFVFVCHVNCGFGLGMAGHFGSGWQTSPIIGIVAIKCISDIHGFTTVRFMLDWLSWNLSIYGPQKMNPNDLIFSCNPTCRFNLYTYSIKSSISMQDKLFEFNIKFKLIIL